MKNALEEDKYALKDLIMKYLIKVLAVALFVQLSFGQERYSKLSNELQDKLDAIVAEYSLPGITFSLRFENDHAINLSSGFEDEDTQRSMTPESKMLSGSVGKIFFGAVALKLTQIKSLNLDDKVMDYLGDTDWYLSFPNAEAITIKNLMNHSSGLPRHLFQPEFLQDFIKDPKKKRLPVASIQSIAGKPAVHPAGQGWAYSDTNYILLGLIIEKVTKQNIYDLVRNEILTPLNLNLTIPSKRRNIEGLAQGHIGSQNPFQLPKKVLDSNGVLVVDPSFEWTGGGFATNPQDLTRLVKYIHESDYLNEQTKAQLKNAVSMVTGQPYAHGYGLGTFVWSKMDDTRYGHSGFFPGYVSHVEYSKNRQYAIAIQVNDDGAYPYLEQITYEMEKVVETHLDKIDRALIMNNFKEQENCWNNHDIECYMQAYAPLETIQKASHDGVTYGYDKIIGNYRKHFPKEGMGKLHFDDISMSRLTDNFYFVTGRFNLKTDGRDELVQGWFSATMKKIKGRWFMITDHSS